MVGVVLERFWTLRVERSTVMTVLATDSYRAGREGTYSAAVEDLRKTSCACRAANSCSNPLVGLRGQMFVWMSLGLGTRLALGTREKRHESESVKTYLQNERTNE